MAKTIFKATAKNIMLCAVYVTAAAVNVIINVTMPFYIAFIVIYFARVPLLG